MSKAKPIPFDEASEASLRRWHRYFGLLLMDQLSGSPFTVELEKDLSQKQQLLDVVVVRRGPGELARPLPDGLDDFVAHNLISFKSYRESLDDWTLKELTGHYVNYRKQVSPRGGLIAEDQFRLYAVCARYPRDLFATIAPESKQPGVFTIRRGSDAMRIVVAADLPLTAKNAFLHLFSAAANQVQYGAEHYRIQKADLSTTVNQLFIDYRQEGLTMPYTIEDYKRDLHREVLAEATPEELLARLTPEQRLAGLPPEQRLAGLPPEQRLAGLPPEQRLAGLPPEQRLAGISAEQIEAYLKRLRKGSPSSRKKRSKPKP